MTSPSEAPAERPGFFAEHRLLILGIALAVLGFGIHRATQSLFRASPRVVAYCAQDQVYAEAGFQRFQRETGIEVRPVFDSEAVKTVGLANRLLAETNHPQCDVFWGNEEMRTRQLAARGVFESWAAFGSRSRRMVVNTNLLPAAQAPASLLELTNAAWRGKVALAFPQFGTTATHFHALRQLWGPVLWEAWCRGLAANNPFLVDGNSAVVKLVGRGEAALGLTDSDDIAAGAKEGLPLAQLKATPETLFIPNTAGIVRRGPHPAEARRLFDFLRTGALSGELVRTGALETETVPAPGEGLKVDWDRLLADLDETTRKLNEIFLR